MDYTRSNLIVAIRLLIRTALQHFSQHYNGVAYAMDCVCLSV